jgi:ATPases involved in chromosome partitioning
MTLRNVVVVANGKGGVGKTSVTANVAGTAALSGWRVLAVDLDPQGNLGNDLGYNAGGASDRGRGLLQAVIGGGPPAVLENVRPGLDVIAGGEATEELEAVLTTRQQRDRSAVIALAEALGRVGDRYQLVMIDCPPSSGILLDAALMAARFLVIPTRGDSGSLDGLVKVARRFAEVRTAGNPLIELLGVVLFDFGQKDTAVLARARERLTADLAGAAPVFEAFVRNSRMAPGDMRDLGLLAHEYEGAATQAPRWFEDRTARRYSRSAGGLAEDYQRLTTEILEAFTARTTALAGVSE